MQVFNMVITGEKRRFKNMAKKEIFQSEEKIENKKKRDSKASFKDFLFSGWILIGQQMSLCLNWWKRAKKEGQDQTEAEHEDRNIDKPQDGGNISESEEDNPINFTINQEPDNLLDDRPITDHENYSDDEPIFNVYGSFWTNKLIDTILSFIWYNIVYII